MPTKAEIIAFIILALALGGAGVFINRSAYSEGKAYGLLACAEKKAENANETAQNFANRPRTDLDTLERLQSWGESIAKRENSAD